MKVIHLVITALLSLVPVAGSLAAEAQSASLAPAPTSQEFATRAWAAGQFAIAASELALRRSVDRKIRRLATDIIEDYQRGNAFLLEAAASNKLKLPEKLDSDLQGRLDRLADASPDQIDAAFTEVVAFIHRLTIPVFAEYSRSGEILSLRFLANRALPTLREHYSSVQQLASR